MVVHNDRHMAILPKVQLQLDRGLQYSSRGRGMSPLALVFWVADKNSRKGSIGTSTALHPRCRSCGASLPGF